MKGLAIEACKQGQEATTVVNAANEISVQAFLDGKIRFTDIAKINEQSLMNTATHPLNNIEDILALDTQSRRYTLEAISKLN